MASWLAMRLLASASYLSRRARARAHAQTRKVPLSRTGQLIIIKMIIRMIIIIIIIIRRGKHPLSRTGAGGRGVKWPEEGEGRGKGPYYKIYYKGPYFKGPYYKSSLLAMIASLGYDPPLGVSSLRTPTPGSPPLAVRTPGPCRRPDRGGAERCRPTVMCSVSRAQSSGAMLPAADRTQGRVDARAGAGQGDAGGP